MHDSQPLEPPAGFFGEHGRAVVGHQCPGQPAFHEGLREPVHEAFGRLGQIKLQMAAQPGAVVADGQRHGPMPAAGGVHDGDFGLVKVQMPEPVDMGHFLAAHFALL